MPYSTVLFDLDHTLLDSDASEAAAFSQTLRASGCHEPDQHFATYRKINGALWAAVERGEISPNDVKTQRFAELVEVIKLDADPEVIGAQFVEGLAQNGDLYPGARRLLDDLAGHEDITVGLVTNGIGSVQRTRLDRLDLNSYFSAVAISGELGTSKPAPKIFDLIFAELDDSDRSESLMVGDSLSSDIAGGVAAGIDTAWFNRHGITPPEPPPFTHEFRILGDLVEIVLRAVDGPT